MPLPKLSKRELMKEQALPSPSTTQRYTVSRWRAWSAVPAGGMAGMARASSISARSLAR
jgi:hypothetical protein